MQNYKNLAKKLFTSQKNNFADFAQTTNTLQFVEQLQPKTYYETYKDLYFGAKFFAVMAQIATAISSYTFFADLFQTKITNQYLLVSSVVVVLAIIETMKYLTLNKALLSIFSLPAKPNYILLSFAMMLSICSIYASVIGGGNLGIDNVKVETVKSEFDNEIATLRTEITDIQKRNSYKGNTYISGKDKKLLHQKENDLKALQGAKTSELNKVHNINENNANTFKIGFGLFDVLFLLCSLYVWNFKKLVAIENLASELPCVDSKQIAIEKVENLGNQNIASANSAIPNQQNKIGFHYDYTHLKKQAANENLVINDENKEIDIITKIVNENRITKIVSSEIVCLHCANSYVKNHHKQKYCSDNCRIAAWELRTNKIFVKGKIK